MVRRLQFVSVSPVWWCTVALIIFALSVSLSSSRGRIYFYYFQQTWSQNRQRCTNMNMISYRTKHLHLLADKLWDLPTPVSTQAQNTCGTDTICSCRRDVTFCWALFAIMSGHGPATYRFRRWIGADTLAPGDVEALNCCQQHYIDRACEICIDSGSFEVQEIPKRWREPWLQSKKPLAEDDLRATRAPRHQGFLYKEATEIEQSFWNLQGDVQKKWPKALLHHLPTMLLAHEWRCWAVLLMDWTNPNDVNRTCLQNRVDLILDLINDRQQLGGAVGFPDLVETLERVHNKLDHIIQNWEGFKAEFTLFNLLDQACQCIDRVLSFSVQYSFFIFLGVDAPNAFQPSRFVEVSKSEQQAEALAESDKQLKKIAETKFGQVLKHLLLDEAVSRVLVAKQEQACVEVSQSGFPRLTDLIENEKWGHLSEAFGFRKTVAARDFFGTGGLADPNLCGVKGHEEDVVKTLLREFEAITAAAKARHLLESTSRVFQSLGELRILLARTTVDCWLLLILLVVKWLSLANHSLVGTEPKLSEVLQVVE